MQYLHILNEAFIVIMFYISLYLLDIIFGMF